MSYDANTLTKEWVSPRPPVVRDELAHIGPGLRFAQSPTNYLRELRAKYGDEFLVDIFGYKLFCVFSPTALKSLYAIDEADASFGMATYDMLGFKTPVEVFIDTDIDLFYELLKPDRVTGYIQVMDTLVQNCLDEWPASGSVDVFDTVRSIEQRVGFGLWIGEEATQDGVCQQFKAHFDVLSQENAFVSPQQTLETLTSNKAKEREAIASITLLVGNIIEARVAANDWPQDTLSFLYERYRCEDSEETLRKVTHNLLNANQGFLSNLYAAIAWSIINLARYPDTAERLITELKAQQEQHGEDFPRSSEALDAMTFSEQLLMESTRLAQRSLTLRKVMQETTFECSEQSYTLQPGIYIATMLSVTNVQTDELAQFNPDHYEGRRLDAALVGGDRETVSTFGHGRHACPAQKFAHNMCKIFLARLMQGFEPEGVSGDLEPSESQMGGVSRTAGETRLSFRRRENGFNA